MPEVSLLNAHRALLFDPIMTLPPLLRSAVLSMIAMTLLAASARGETRVYFGTYTGGKSKGVYVARLDSETGRLSAPVLAAESASPSFIAIDPTGRFLYTVNEVGNFQGQKSGAVSAFAVNAADGKLTFLNQQPSGGGGPCHLTVDASGKNVLVANYGGGSCAVLPIDGQGRVQPATAFQQHQGASVNKQRQEGPHAHGIYLDKRSRFAFVPDLGLDKVMSYKFDANQGSLTPNDPPFASVAPGSGPRHLAFAPDGAHAYVINEMLCTIAAFHYDPDRGILEPLQTVSTLPSTDTLKPSYSTAEIFVHPSGRFVYGSNRGHNSLAVFAIDPNSGSLTPVQHQSTQGKTPRGFGIDPSGRYLVAANQDSDSVVVFRIDPATGKLSLVDQKVEVGSPVSVTFATVSGRP